MFAAEAKARAARRGLWAEAASGVQPVASLARGAEEVAADPACAAPSAEAKDAPRRPRSRFTVAEGRVVTVRPTDQAVFLNFGPDYRRDFGVRVAKDMAEAWPGGAEALGALAGKTVRVRGLLPTCAKPLLRLDDPAALEVIK